jgi:hypothetical protein
MDAVVVISLVPKISINGTQEGEILVSCRSCQRTSLSSHVEERGAPGNLCRRENDDSIEYYTI